MNTVFNQKSLYTVFRRRGPSVTDRQITETKGQTCVLYRSSCRDKQLKLHVIRVVIIFLVIYGKCIRALEAGCLITAS